MPKILFRPAPTPPPFVPPTPTYDTTVYAKTNPFPVESGYFFTIKFSPANVPAFDNVKLWICAEPLQHDDQFASISMTSEDFDKNLDAQAFYNSDAAPYLSIEFYMGGTKVHEANLVLSEL